MVNYCYISHLDDLIAGIEYAKKNRLALGRDYNDSNSEACLVP